MHAAANAFLLVYAGLFPIVNPVGCAPIFLALTSRHTAKVRRNLARRVAINGFVLMLGSLFVGSHVLVFFGITLPVVRIAGGLAVASFGWRLLRDGIEPAQHGGPVDDSGPVDAFYPLTMPLTVGPGSISVAIALGAERPEQISGFVDLGLVVGAAALGLAAMALTIFSATALPTAWCRCWGPAASMCWCGSQRSSCCASGFRSPGAGTARSPGCRGRSRITARRGLPRLALRASR
jgi:multiple antibiotic resistance protein